MWFIERIFGNNDIGLIKKYEDLEISPATLDLLLYDTKTFKSFCNGVGSKVGFWSTIAWHLLPNTIWFLGITGASDLHDVDYSVPMIFKTESEAFEYKEKADIRFNNNVNILISKDTSWLGKKLINQRIERAELYYWALKNAGTDSFIEGKIISEES